MRGHVFVAMLQEEFARQGTAGLDIFFRTESGDYVPLDVTTDADGTVVLLLEEGK